MTLNFSKHQENNERGSHYGAIGGNWPHQRRYIIEKRENEWRVEVHRHVPGQGFVFISGDYAKTLKSAKDKCTEIECPHPIDRNSSSYTDA